MRRKISKELVPQIGMWDKRQQAFEDIQKILNNKELRLSSQEIREIEGYVYDAFRGK